MGVQIPFQVLILIPLELTSIWFRILISIPSGVELLDHKVVQFLILWGSTILFSITPVYQLTVPPTVYRGSLFSISSSTFFISWHFDNCRALSSQVLLIPATFWEGKVRVWVIFSSVKMRKLKPTVVKELHWASQGPGQPKVWGLDSQLNLETMRKIEEEEEGKPSLLALYQVEVGYFQMKAQVTQRSYKQVTSKKIPVRFWIASGRTRTCSSRQSRQHSQRTVKNVGMNCGITSI